MKNLMCCTTPDELDSLLDAMLMQLEEECFEGIISQAELTEQEEMLLSAAQNRVGTLSGAA